MFLIENIKHQPQRTVSFAYLPKQIPMCGRVKIVIKIMIGSLKTSNETRCLQKGKAGIFSMIHF